MTVPPGVERKVSSFRIIGITSCEDVSCVDKFDRLSSGLPEDGGQASVISMATLSSGIGRT